MFKHIAPGYWYRLISFTSEKTQKNKYVAWVNAVFQTQKDSVFYDTKNDLQDRFFVKIDTSVTDHFLKRAVSLASEGDSICILVKPKDFFAQQFQSNVPGFCANDSAVKVFFKIKKVFTESEYKHLVSVIENKEYEEIEAFFGSAENFEMSKDSLGFYWVERPTGTGTVIAIAGDMVFVNYEGGFLNGRIIDVSPEGFQVNYGTPDQLLKGLNYVIGKLKKGQTSKIILPSHLAFGESGSGNGSVPPFTPMLYKISITDIKTKEAD